MTLEAHQGRFSGERHATGIVAFPTARGLRNQMQADNKRAVAASSMEADRLGPSKRVAGIDILTAAETALGNVGWNKPHSDALQAVSNWPSGCFPPARSGAVP